VYTLRLWRRRERRSAGRARCGTDDRWIDRDAVREFGAERIADSEWVGLAVDYRFAYWGDTVTDSNADAGTDTHRRHVALRRQ
jgi:hypothetical protein